MSICTWIIIISVICIIVGIIIAFCESEYGGYEHTVIEIIATILIIGGFCCVIAGAIVKLATTPTQHYRIQYMNSNGEVIIIEDAINVDYKKDSNGLVEYECDGDRYTIKSNFIEIKEKKNK